MHHMSACQHSPLLESYANTCQPKLIPESMLSEGRAIPDNRSTCIGVPCLLCSVQFLAGGKDTSQLGRGSLLLAGGVGGAAFWASVYPADVIKSMIQVDDYRYCTMIPSRH